MKLRSTLAWLSTVALTFAASSAFSYDIQDCWKASPPEQQIANCSKIIDQKPAPDLLTDALLHRGSAYVAKSMLKQAIADYAQALKAKPGHTQVLAARAQANLKAREFDKAIADFTAAIRSDEKLASAYVGRGYAHLVKNELQEAIADFTAALNISPSYAVAINNRGLAYKKLSNPKQAIADFSQAIRINPVYALAYNNRGYTYEQVGEKAKAIDDYRNALSIDPSLIGALNGLQRLSAAANIATQSTKRIAEGRQLAERNCAWCHAIGNEDGSPNERAPRFRDIHARHPILSLREPITRAIVTPHDTMPKLDLSSAQIDVMIAYINSLRPER